LNTAIAANLYGQLNLQAKNVLFVTETLNPYGDLAFNNPNNKDIKIVNFDCETCFYGIDVLINYA